MKLQCKMRRFKKGVSYNKLLRIKLEYLEFEDEMFYPFL